MNPFYNQDYTKAEITAILAEIKTCIRKNSYFISINERRQENKNFINKYSIRLKQQKQILLGITVDDFCHSIQNTKIGFEFEVLYVFVPNILLHNEADETEKVDIYIKFNLISMKNGKKVVVISFHKRNKSIKYCFK